MLCRPVGRLRIGPVPVVSGAAAEVPDSAVCLADSQAVESPVLVGRGREVDRLSALLNWAVGGQPLVALVAGFGKPRLVREVSAVAAQRGCGC